MHIFFLVAKFSFLALAESVLVKRVESVHYLLRNEARQSLPLSDIFHRVSTKVPVKVHVPYRLRESECILFAETLEELILRAPLSHDDILSVRLRSFPHMDEEAHAILVVFVLQCKVDVVGAWRDRLKTLELRACLPKLIVNAELHSIWALEQ